MFSFTVVSGKSFIFNKKNPQPDRIVFYLRWTERLFPLHIEKRLFRVTSEEGERSTRCRPIVVFFFITFLFYISVKLGSFTILCLNVWKIR